MADKTFTTSAFNGGRVVIQSEWVGVAPTLSDNTATITLTTTDVADGLTLTITEADAGAVSTEVVVGSAGTVLRSVIFEGADGAFNIALDSLFERLGPNPLNSEYYVRVYSLDSNGDRTVPARPALVFVDEQEPEVISPPQLDAGTPVYVGAVITYIPPGTNTTPFEVTGYLEEDEGTDGASFVTVGTVAANPVVPNIVGSRLRVVYSVLWDEGGTPEWVSSDPTAAIQTLPVETPPALDLAHVVLLDSEYAEGQEVWYRADIRIERAGLPVAAQSLNPDTHLEFRWSGVIPHGENITDGNSEWCEVVSYDATYIVVRPRMDEAAREYQSDGSNSYDLNADNIGDVGSPYEGQRMDWAYQTSTSAANTRYAGIQYRYDVGGWTDWSLQSSYQTVPAPVLAPPEVGDEAWFPIIYRTPEEAAAAESPQGYFPTGGRVGGHGAQWFEGGGFCDADPNVGVFGQDMGGLIVTENRCLTSYAPANRGLRAFNTIALTIDPADPDLHIYLAGFDWTSIDFNTYGIWVSTDRSRNYSQTINLPDMERHLNHGSWRNLFARYPRTGGVPSTAKWRLAFRNYAVNQVYLLESTGPTSWTIKNGGNPVSFSGMGGLLGVYQHPTQEQTVYLLFNNGVYRTTNWNATTPGWTRMWAAQFGSGCNVCDMWIDPENSGTIMIPCAGAASGLQYTTNGGANWTRTLNGKRAHLGVGAKRGSGTRTVYIHSASRVDRGIIHRRNWNSNTDAWADNWFSNPAINTSSPITADRYVQISGWGSTGGGGFCTMHPHPTNPDEAVSYSYTQFWDTVDAGSSWTLRNDYNEGVEGPEVIFSDTEWDTYWMVLADKIFSKWSNNGQVSERTELTGPQQTALKAQVCCATAMGACRLPQSCEDVSARGRMIFNIGSGERTMGHRDAGDPKVTNIKINDNFAVDKFGGLVSTWRARVGFKPSEPNKVCCGQHMSTDYGLTASITLGNNAKFIDWGVTGDMVGFNGNALLYSTNDGVSFSTIYTRAGDAYRGDIPEIWTDPNDLTRIYTSSLTLVGYTASNPPQPKYGYELVCVNDGTPTVVPLYSYLYDPQYPVKNYRIHHVAVDPVDTHWFYVALSTIGDAIIFRLKWNSGFTAIESVTDISSNYPRIGVRNSLHVSPHTREIIGITVRGPYIHGPPPGVTGLPSLRAYCPVPVDNHWEEVYT